VAAGTGYPRADTAGCSAVDIGGNFATEDIVESDIGSLRAGQMFEATSGWLNYCTFAVIVG